MVKIIVNGTFDIVHYGHLCLLNYAKSLGDYLLVCTDSDRRIKELKGSTRPINNQLERVSLLENLKAVNEVKVFDSAEELIDIIFNYQPDIMVKGSDHKNSSIVGKTYCKQVIFYERLNGYSTTEKIRDIASR
jgi:rfaE bifunctional protein nucleotidyltransferase chain/domain